MARNPYFERYCRHAFWRSNAYIFFFDNFYRHRAAPPPVSRTVEYHQKIFEAIARHDPEEARRLMEQHIIVTYEGLLCASGAPRTPPLPELSTNTLMEVAA